MSDRLFLAMETLWNMVLEAEAAGEYDLADSRAAAAEKLRDRLVDLGA